MRSAKKILAFALMTFFGLALFLVLIFFFFSRNLPSLNQITNRQIPESTKIYDRTGKVLLYEISNGQKRTTIPLKEIPQSLKDATIAIEDTKFYEEAGFSFKGILRALLANLSRGKIVQGGSTITQQLAKNAFLSADRTLARKIKEFILSIQLNRHYSKDQILELYLNEIPYGPTIYGVEAASLAFFNKPAKDLTLAESALLAALPKAPSYYSPWGNHKKELLDRQKLVLKRMLELKKITPQEHEESLKTKLSFAPQDDGIKAPHFVIFIQDYLTQKYGDDLIRVGGLKVITTLDWELQQLAEKVVAEGARRNEELYQGKNAALAVEDPKTGQILSLVGSRDYFDTKNEGNFDVATQGLRQPGSALKPFAYLTAFEKGYAPETVLFDVPTEFDSTGNPEKSYRPENFDNRLRGPINLRRSLAESVNIPSVKILYLAGLKNVLETLRNFGVTTLTDPNRYGLSLVLGGGEVKLIDLIKAYSVLAQDGVKREQTTILEIRDSKGNLLESFKDTPERVVDPEYPRLVNDILSDVEARSNLYTASLGLTMVPGHDIALKTGTSNDYRDAWVFGYTPFMVTGVWAGNNDNSPMQRRGSSILAAIPIWHAFMSEALKNKNPEAFIRPDPLTPQKPILAGDYLAGRQIHSILYSVDRENPSGPYPPNPEADPQFLNWEKGVLDWAKINLTDFPNYNQPGSSLPSLTNPIPSALSYLGIVIKKPKAGEFITNSLLVEVEITAASNISEINLSFNNQLIQKFDGILSPTYHLNWQFTPLNPSPQNLLEIEVVTQDNRRDKASVIVYK